MPVDTAAAQQARAQLAAYAAVAWAPEELVEVRCLPTERQGGPRPKSLWLTAAELPDAAEPLEALNARGLNVYAGILPRRAKGGKADADCAPGRVVWADFDHTTPRAAWKKARAAGLPRPTMAVNSGHGAHLFWKLTEPADPAELSELVGSVARLCGSDASVRNPSRILRLPGLTNLKPPEAPCVLLYADPERTYTPDVLRAEADPAAALERARRYASTVEGRGKGGRTNTAFRVACALVRDFALTDAEALPVLEAWDRAANVPPIPDDYGPEELAKILRNARRYGKHAEGTKTRAMDRDPEPAAHITLPTDPASDLDAVESELEAQSRGERDAVELPWRRLSGMSRALRAGTVCVLAGPPGTGKSFFATHFALAVHRAGHRWAYLPLEDRKTDFLLRVLAVLAGDYRLIEADPEGADYRGRTFERYQEELLAAAAFVSENPRAPLRREDGRVIVPPVPPGAVVEWLRAELERARVAFVDPISQIDFDGRDPWRAEGRFMRECLALAADSGGTIVLVAHTAKRPGKAASLPLTLEDVQGSASFGRNAHTVLLLDAHDQRSVEVLRPHGCRETVEHDRTVVIAKARNAGGGRRRLAYLQGKTAPEFEELGVIAPKSDGAPVQGT